MRPVSVSGLQALVEENSILMLDATRLYIRHMMSLVPANISSKQGDKKLPLELWYEILELADVDHRSNKYYLVQPQTLQQNKNGSATLKCAAVSEWNKCGALEDASDVEAFEYFLARPTSCQDSECYHPLSLPGNDAEVFSIPTVALENILFERLCVPDVIARTERGRCHLCGNWREFCMGCSQGRRVAEEWTSLEPVGDCSVTMLCPLCIGVELAEESVDRQRELDDEPYSETKWDGYEAWVDARMMELGYM